ncbi:MAG: malic enzyme-like NAD(P)-binding protein, partial [Clostridiaceae bacterium]
VSAPGILKPEMVKLMNKDSIIFAMANPTPEIMPDEAKAAGARVIGTGRSDFPNQVNNVLVFPGLFRGALDVRSKEINLEMKLAAAYAIADYIGEKDLNEENVIPSALDKGVAAVVAEAIRIAAKETGTVSLAI